MPEKALFFVAAEIRPRFPPCASRLSAGSVWNRRRRTASMGCRTKRLHPCPTLAPVRGGDLPEYVFTIRSGGQTLAPARVVACNDDDEALGHACAMVRKLRKDG